jgi:hypothetical protein
MFIVISLSIADLLLPYVITRAQYIEPLHHYDFVIAANLHALKHMPHLMHFAWSIVWSAFGEPVIAPVGQTRLHAPQPTHLSMIV